jgi:PAS domain S-box-containing protein
MELAATLLALIVGVLALMLFYAKKDNTFLFIGTGFIGTGFLDGYHTLVTSSVFMQYFPSPPPSLIPWSWLASRLFLSVLLWLSWVFWRREVRRGEAGSVPESLVYLIVSIWTLACFFFFAFVPLPRAYDPIPVFHRPQEFIPAIFYLFALVGYLRKGRWKSDTFEHWLVLSIIVGFVSQAVFMSTSGKLYDAMFDAAHLLKKLSYICTLVGLIAAMYQLFIGEESVRDHTPGSRSRAGAVVSLKAGIVTGIAIAIFVPLMVGLTSIMNMRRMARADETLFREGTAPLPQLSNIAVSFQQMRIASRDLLEAPAGIQAEKFESQIDLLSDEIDKLSNAYEVRELSPDARIAFNDFKATRKGYLEYLTQIRALARAGQGGKGWAILNSPAHNSAVHAHMTAINTLENLQIKEAKQIIASNARLAWLSMVGVAVAMFLASGFAVGGALWLNHLTGQKIQAQEALQLSEYRFQLVSRATNDGIWDWDLLAGDVWWSDNVQTAFGYAPNEIKPGFEGWESHLHPEDRERVTGKLAAAIASGAESWSDEFRFRRRDGSYANVLDRGHIIHDSAGRPIRMVGAMMDISQRKQAEAELEFRNVLLTTQQEASIDGILVVGENGKMISFNQRFVEMWGIPADVIAEKSDERALQAAMGKVADPERFVQGVKLIYQSHGATRDELNLADGRTFDRYTAPLLGADGKYYGRVWYFRDMTERRRVLDEIQKAKSAAEAANRAKSEFLANMSHELRTPMNGIMGMTDLALDTELSSEQREYLTMVKISADSLLTLINDILDFSKIEAGKLEFESIDFNLRNSLETTLKVFATRADEKGIELNCDVHPDVPETLIGDPTRLRQIVVNLVGNAIKFTERGEVTVEVACESKESNGLMLHFSVRDTGIGIPPERQEVIFEAFTQADGSTTRRYGGSGLGLTVSRRLVNMFGGHLWLDSVVGQGSTFHFTVRLGVGAESGWAVPLVSTDLQGVSVLVVDDNATNRRILDEQLTRWHMKPTLAADSRTALQHLQQRVEAGNPFPLVLIDSKMPEMDGFTLVEQIKQDPRLATLKMMMLTSAGQRGDAARCRKLGVAAYLTKPIGQSELLKGILHVLGTHPKKAEPSALVTRHSLRERNKALRVLLAEDNLVSRAVATRFLEKQGYTVEVATDGREALTKVRGGNFDLVLMDVQMPEIDGFEATRAIREMEKTKGGHIHIIAMTAHALKGDRERCLSSGMDGYISKPFRPEELLSEIEALSAVPAKSLQD